VATEWFAHARPINVIRFLGTTPDSSALTATLISICQQVKSIQKTSHHLDPQKLTR